MSLRAKHERHLYTSLEDTSKHAVVIKFDLSSPDLEWHGVPGTVVTPTFSLCGLTDIVSRQSDSIHGVGITTRRSSAHIRISTMQDKVGGVPSEGTKITACDEVGERNFIVEKGQTLVDASLGLGIITYLLTDLGEVE